MIWTIIFKAIMFGLAGVFNAVMDKLQFHYNNSIFPKAPNKWFLGGEKFWNPDISWRNKYKDWPNDKKAKFPFSTTALVFLTDGWHLAQFFMLACFAAASVPIVDTWWEWGIWFIVLRVVFGIVFTAFFHNFLSDESEPK